MPQRFAGSDNLRPHGKSHKFLTLVYQIDAGCTRLLWVGQARTKQSFEKFFTLIGEQLAGKIEFICSDMWRPYLEVIAKRCPQALNILDRFHMVAKLNKALDELIVVNHAGEARRMVREGYEPVLKNKRWCLLKRPENLTDKQNVSLRELLAYNLKSVRAYLLKEEFQLFWEYDSPAWAAKILDAWCKQASDALAHRSGEEVRPHGARAPGVVARLLQGQEAVLQRRDRGAEQQSQSHTEKSVRLSDVQDRRTLSVSRAWQAPGAETCPQILLMKRISHPPP